MNSQSNAPEAVLDARVLAPAAVSATRPFYWSIRRELLENRSIYIAPLMVAGVFLLGFMVTTGALPNTMRALPTLSPAQQHQRIAQPYDFAAGVLMLTQILVGVFYSLEALHGERRDRSILFWKSLPVSDRTTVFAKASVPIMIVPLLSWAVTAATQLIMLLLSTAVVAGSGQSVATLWAQVSVFQTLLMLLYHLVTVHSLWHAPIYGWLLLVSAWARRAVFLWAVLPVLAILAVEKIAFNTSHFGALLIYRFAGGPEAMAMATGNMPIDIGTHLTPGRFLISPGLWIGLAVTAAFLITAARLRRYRGPI